VSKHTISAVIVTLNEEANIRRCLDSVRWADEIIIVDSGSTDRTLDICKEYGCLVFNHEWEGYSRQKNFAIALAKSDWVLSLDADEEITPELAKEMISAVGSASPADGYVMPRSSLFLGRWMRHGGWYPDPQLRLFKRGTGTFKDVPLHEHIIMRDGSARIESLRNPILHYTYPTVADFVKRGDSYTTIEAEAILADGQAPRCLALRLMMIFPLKFLETYVYKVGWRDGIHGLIAATLVSARVFMRYAKVWQSRNG
jgi:glycosyltransferase involved in cell wall biosynthesis